MYIACIQAGENWQEAPYCILGDDVIVCHDEIAENYLKLVRSIGVEVSDPKTHRSFDFCEFAKRYYFRGEEISPFPIGALRESNRY